MNQTTKTLTFAGVALATTVLAWATRSVPVQHGDSDGQVELFKDFTDPAQAKSLKIVRFDESLASLNEIEVREDRGLWTLPSHDGYPADAENRIRDATTPFIGLQTLAVVSQNDGDHSLFGVLEPNIDKSAVGDEGVGTLVTVKGESNKDLVNLIIGKEVKDAEGQRYVRKPGQPYVYIAKVDPDNLPVRFEDWIEKDLLQVSGFDIQQLELRDYNFDVVGRQINYDQRYQFKVSDDNGTWKLDEMMEAQNGELVLSELGEDEQLKQQSLTDLKNALDNLEIIGVQRKPEKLGADLRTDQGFANDQQGIESLMARGYYPVTMPDGNLEVLSADGEVLARTKDGVEYVLRFGAIEGVDTEQGEGALNRYLMVSARVHDATFPPPELEDIPQSIEDLAQPEEESADNGETTVEESADEVEATSENGESDSASSDETPAGGDEGEATENSAEVDESSELEATDETNAGENGEVVEESSEAESDLPLEDSAEPDANDGVQSASGTETLFVQATDNDQEAAVSVDDSQDEVAADPASTQDADSGESDGGDAETEDLEAKLKSEQERITKENQRKIDERNDKIEKAQQKVSELNYRFADWYYVISEEVYQKIHLGREDVVEPASSGDDASAGGPAGGSPIPGGSPFNNLGQ